MCRRPKRCYNFDTVKNSRREDEMKRGHYIQILVGAVLAVLVMLAVLKIREAGGGVAPVTWMTTEEAAELIKARRAMKAEHEQAKKPKQPEPAAVQPPCTPCVMVDLCEEPEPEPEEPKPRTVWPNMGPHTASSLAGHMAMMREASLGYTPNDLVIGKIFDNEASRQKGVVEAVVDYSEFLYKKSRPRAAGLNAVVQGDYDKWWFTRSEKVVENSARKLRDVAQAMDKGRIKIKADPDNALDMLELSIKLLAREQQSLLASESEIDNDDRFHHARGVAAVAGGVVAAAPRDFTRVTEGKNLKKELEKAMKWLEEAERMDPVFVLGGDPSEFSSNHLIIMAHALSRAQNALEEVSEKIATGEYH